MSWYQTANLHCLIDLHLHLDGSLSLNSIRQLAAMQNIPLPQSDTELAGLVSVRDHCRDLNEYLEKFHFPLSLLQTAPAISQAVYTLAEELRQQGLIYAEIRFAPQLHTDQNLTQQQVVEAAIDGLRKSALQSSLILCCMRGDTNKTANLETICLAKDYLGAGVSAVDLAGAEALYPTGRFAEEFALARRLVLPFTIHAGEAAGPDSVRAAISLGASRIGHGVRSVEDESLVEQLAYQKIPLELCPTSNLQTQVFRDISSYPFRQLLQAGVKITVNTDNLTVSNTSLQREWQLLIDTFHLTKQEVQQVLLNSADAAFAQEDVKKSLRAQIRTAMNC